MRGMSQEAYNQLRERINMIGQVMMYKKQQERERAQGIQDVFGKAAMEGKINLMPGADLSTIGQDWSSVLGQRGKLWEAKPDISELKGAYELAEKQREEGAARAYEVTGGAPPLATELNPIRQAILQRLPKKQIGGIGRQPMFREMESALVEPQVQEQFMGRAQQKIGAYEKFKGAGKKTEPSYTDQFRADLQDASERIMAGENTEEVTNEMIQRYPSSMTADIIYNLRKEIGPAAQRQSLNLRKQAIDALKSAGYPTSEANIKSAIEQLKGK